MFATSLTDSTWFEFLRIKVLNSLVNFLTPTQWDVKSSKPREQRNALGHRLTNNVLEIYKQDRNHISEQQQFANFVDLIECTKDGILITEH